MSGSTAWPALKLYTLLLLLVLHLLWRSWRWYKGSQAFNYRWLIYLIPVAGLELAEWLWKRLSLSMNGHKPGVWAHDEAFNIARINGWHYMPLMVLLIAHLASSRAGMTRQTTVLEAIAVVLQAVIFTSYSYPMFLTTDFSTHCYIWVHTLLLALRIVYLGKIVRQHLVSEAQLFGIGLIALADPFEVVVAGPPTLDTHGLSIAEYALQFACSLLIWLTQYWFVPMLVLSRLGSLSSAMLQLLPAYGIGAVYGWSITSKYTPNNIWWRVGHGLNTVLTLLVFASMMWRHDKELTSNTEELTAPPISSLELPKRQNAGQDIELATDDRGRMISVCTEIHLTRTAGKWSNVAAACVGHTSLVHKLPTSSLLCLCYVGCVCHVVSRVLVVAGFGAVVR